MTRICACWQGADLIKPVLTDALRYVFMLPRGVSEVRLVSHAAAPSDACPWLEDRRRLGVQVARLVVRGGDELCDIPLDHPSLVSGWWAAERDGIALRRWTDGNAVLPLPAVGGVPMLEIAVPARSPTPWRRSWRWRAEAAPAVWQQAAIGAILPECRIRRPG